MADLAHNEFGHPIPSCKTLTLIFNKGNMSRVLHCSLSDFRNLPTTHSAHFDLGFSNATEVQAAAAALKMDPQKVTNNADVEMQWAVRACQHAETHFNLISSVDPRVIRLTRIDDEIYTRFRQEFADFPVEVLREEQLKSPEAKEKWRPFCSYFENKVEDFNMGTLIRIDSRKEFSEENSMLVLRIQFLAVEIARNREGYNDGIRKLRSELVVR